MSPEQARGDPVDKRTDIWSFGCLLFEMLAARRPFGNKGVVDTVTAILEQEPDWSALPGDTPQRVFVRCFVDVCARIPTSDSTTFMMRGSKSKTQTSIRNRPHPLRQRVSGESRGLARRSRF